MRRGAVGEENLLMRMRRVWKRDDEGEKINGSRMGRSTKRGIQGEKEMEE